MSSTRDGGCRRCLSDVEVLPLSDRQPAQALLVVAAFAAARPDIDSRLNVGVTCDAALAALRPELIRQGFEIEKGNGRQALSERRRME